jgi:hypothetical protein
MGRLIRSMNFSLEELCLLPQAAASEAKSGWNGFHWGMNLNFDELVP